MRYWLHIVLPLSAGVVVFFAQMSLSGDPARATFTLLVGTTVKVLAMIGAGVAASSFDRTDYLRRAWLLIVANYAFIIVNLLVAGTTKPLLFGLNAVHFYGVVPGSPTAEYLRSIGVIVGNTLGVVGTVMLARAWSVAGLEAGHSAALRGTVIFGALAVALLLIGRPAFNDVGELLREHSFNASIDVASDLGDFVGFALVAPLLLTAISLRGGVLMWPWALYTGSQLSWMMYDALMSLPASHASLSLGESARVTACLLSLSAGLAQHHAVNAPQGRAVAVHA